MYVNGFSMKVYNQLCIHLLPIKYTNQNPFNSEIIYSLWNGYVH